MTSPLRRIALVASSAALLSLSLASCSSASGGPTTDSTGGAEESTDDGRVFDSTDDAVITAIESALKSSNASAQWNDTVLVVTMDGSIDEATAWLPCGAASAVIAETETAKLIYDDGELLCSERPGYGTDE